MASEKLFKTIPPFPDDLPMASMSTISLAGLSSGNQTSAKGMLDACQKLGFFLLDLHGDTLGESLVQEIDELFGAMREIMDLPDEVKEKYQHDVPKSFLGFKPRGTARTETLEPDRFEWFNLGQDGLLGTSAMQPVPDAVARYRELFTSFLKHGQTIVSAINKSLAEQLGLPVPTFTALQDPAKPSGTVVRLIRAEPSPAAADLRTSMIHHTDFGTVTLLANVLGGLQILAPGGTPADTGAWRWVRPQPRCLVVNLGDAMVQWTGGLLRSNVHRVNYAPGEQRFLERYSAAILVRPERNASMRSFVHDSERKSGTEYEGEALTAWEWEVKKMMELRRGNQIVESKGGIVMVEV